MNQEFHYIFSGSLTDSMMEGLLRQPDYKPIDVLVTQLDRTSVKKMMEYHDKGYIASLFLDSGAWTQHSQGISLNVDEYIEFANSIDDYLIALAQVDRIPGRYKQPKTPEDYVESAKLSWENYLYMRKKLKSPDKLVPVFHYGEDFSNLKNMLSWTDEFGNHIEYIGISPANDVSQKDKNIYMREVYDIIKSSENPDVKTHLFGMSSLDALSKFPCYSCDSVSHRLRTGYNKLFTRKWGTISLSDRSRTSKTKSNMCFDKMCDQNTLSELTDFISNYGYTLDEVKESNVARVVIDIMETYKAAYSEYAYNENNLKRNKKIFNF